MSTGRPHGGRGNGSIPKLNTARRIIACWKRSLHRYLEKPPTSVPHCARYLAIELLDFPEMNGYASDVTELASASVNIASANCGRQHQSTAKACSPCMRSRRASACLSTRVKSPRGEMRCVVT